LPARTPDHPATGECDAALSRRHYWFGPRRARFEFGEWARRPPQPPRTRPTRRDTKAKSTEPRSQDTHRRRGFKCVVSTWSRVSGSPWVEAWHGLCWPRETEDVHRAAALRGTHRVHHRKPPAHQRQGAGTRLDALRRARRASASNCGGCQICDRRARRARASNCGGCHIRLPAFADRAILLSQKTSSAC
jgi:hypothetical protein